MGHDHRYLHAHNAEIIQLSKDGNILTQQTAFVGQDMKPFSLAIDGGKTGGKIILADVHSTDTIREIKERINDKLNEEQTLLHLLFMGVTLDDHASLARYNIHGQSNLTFITDEEDEINTEGDADCDGEELTPVFPYHVLPAVQRRGPSQPSQEDIFGRHIPHMLCGAAPRSSSGLFGSNSSPGLFGFGGQQPVRNFSFREHQPMSIGSSSSGGQQSMGMPLAGSSGSFGSASFGGQQSIGMPLAGSSSSFGSQVKVRSSDIVFGSSSGGSSFGSASGSFGFASQAPKVEASPIVPDHVTLVGLSKIAGNWEDNDAVWDCITRYEPRLKKASVLTVSFTC